MTRLTAVDLTPFYRNSVGLDRLFDRITSSLDSNTLQANYPPYDIVKYDEDTYEIKVAVAGFKQGEISVQFHENLLTISGEQKRERLTGEFVYNGISRRNFVRSWPVGDYVEVAGATVEDGLLSVRLERRVPESLKPKTIDITYNR